MISYLEGEIITGNGEFVILNVNGVGYKIFITKYKHTSPLKLFIYHHVGSDNQQKLYGMTTLDQLAIFELLLKVSGIGPKIAQKIIESSSEVELKTAISDGDINYFTRVKGLGKKNAQKIILELKNKLIEPSQGKGVVYQALSSLGFTTHEIDNALVKIDPNGLEEEEIIELVLKNIK